MCTMKLTVDITMSIITEIGSKSIPKSKCNAPRGSHVTLYGTTVAKVPSARRGAVKYWKAVM